MKIKVTQIGLRESEMYPYTHRMEFDSDNHHKYNLVEEWIKEKDIKCCIMPTYGTDWTKKLCVYVTKQDAVNISLRWL